MGDTQVLGITRLKLSLPCRLNQLYTPYGRRLILSKRARERTKLIVSEVHEQLGGEPDPYDCNVQVQVVVTPRDKRIPDVDAYPKNLLDSLTKAKVWIDDKQVKQLSIEVLDPKFPGGVEVEVYPLRSE